MATTDATSQPQRSCTMIVSASTPTRKTRRGNARFALAHSSMGEDKLEKNVRNRDPQIQPLNTVDRVVKFPQPSKLLFVIRSVTQ